MHLLTYTCMLPTHSMVNVLTASAWKHRTLKSCLRTSPVGPLGADNWASLSQHSRARAREVPAMEGVSQSSHALPVLTAIYPHTEWEGHTYMLYWVAH